MRNEALTGYLLHQRPYQEKRALYYLFSQQHGVIHGIGKKGAPLFEPLQLFATGKRELKTFTQINLAPLAFNTNNTNNENATEVDKDSIQPQRYEQITGQQQYAALYLNEILWKLLPTEDPMPALWQHYQNSLLILKQPLTAIDLRLCLRQFEHQLFQELGFELILTHDNSRDAIDANCDYRFLADVGLVPVFHRDNGNAVDNNSNERSITQALFSGSEILTMVESAISADTLNLWSRLHRHLIDNLLDYQPLQSRLLWQQQQRYQ
ncbi:DNA repair protein RecO [Psychrobacter jeotgali]|uniref:DNA repair protein RecO n=1 Tax=Psychrobacter jeotgali TaxID=179010 RepID=UPI00191AD0B4|nr:DNA repair protein RecO C-terminal domain-containing protein [Psychrobacter jeotgali]